MQMGTDKRLQIDFSNGEEDLQNLLDFEDSSPIEVYDDQSYEEESEEIEIEISEKEIYDALVFIFNKNPEIVRLLSRKYSAVIQDINTALSEFFGADLSIDDLQSTFPRIKAFIYLTSIGVLVGAKYINVVPSNVKLILETSDLENSIYIRTTSAGRVYKSIPLISFFTKSEVNSTIHKFFKDKFPSSVNADYCGFYMSSYQEAETERKISEINIDFNSLSDLEIVSYIIENGGLTEELIANLEISNFPQRRLDKISKIIKMMG